jgi:hypothetical protein
VVSAKRHAAGYVVSIRCATELALPREAKLHVSKLTQRRKALNWHSPITTQLGQPEQCRDRNLPAFALVSACVEPPAGIEPATPSLPCIPGPPPCYPAFSQVAAHRTRRSYGVVAVLQVGLKPERPRRLPARARLQG